MKLPEDVVIPEDKLVRYLLLPREENDKSQFLGIAGYILGTWEVLARDLHDLAKTYEAVTQKSPCEGKRVIMGEESALKLSQRGLDARQGGAHANPEAIIRPRTYDLST